MQLKRFNTGCLLILMAAVSALAQSTPQAGVVPAAPPRSADAAQASGTEHSLYRLGSGDQLLVRAANSPDLNEKTFRIDTDGYIDAPTVGRVKAAGRTVEDVQKDMVKRLSVLLQEPDVAVSVAEYQSQPVSIFGEVAAPGVHQLQGSKTLIEMLSMAGGIKAGAGPMVLITRKLENGRIPLPGAKDDPTGRFSIAQVDLKPLMDARTPDKDILIMPDDVISVPRAELIYIAGDVTKSGPLFLTDRETMSVLEALSATGGVTKTADTKKARIMRMVPGSPIRQQLPVNIGNIMSGKAEDVQMVAGDILVVPPSNMKKAAQRTLESAIQMGTMIVTTGIVAGTL